MSSKRAAIVLGFIIVAAIWGALFYVTFTAAPAPAAEARLVESGEWFAVEHESGAIWVFRKDQIAGFVFTNSNSVRNQILLQGGRVIHTKHNMGAAFKKMLGVSDEGIKPVGLP